MSFYKAGCFYVFLKFSLTLSVLSRYLTLSHLTFNCLVVNVSSLPFLNLDSLRYFFKILVAKNQVSNVTLLHGVLLY